MAVAAPFASLVAVLAGLPSPLEGTAETLMEWTPVPVASFLLIHAGSVARPAALLGAFALALLCGGIAGAIGGAVAAVAPTTIGINVVVGGALLAVVFLGLLSPAAVGPVVLMVVIFAAVMLGLELRPVRRAGRREFLTRTGAIVGGAGALIALYYLRPLIWATGGRLAAYKPPPGLDATGITHLVTPQNRFYVNDKVLQAPDIGASGWHFAISGAVRREVGLDYPGLLARPATRRYITMECVDNPVGGPLIGNALWTGVRVVDLLGEAGARGEMVIFSAADNYAEGVPRKLLEQHDALIAYAMNGETLTREHGYPARLLVPGLYGFKSVKWLTGMEVVGGSYEDMWRKRGWSGIPIVRTTTRIDAARRQGDRVVVAGIAFAGDRGIRAVEVRTNGGTWVRAQLGPILGRAAWVQWVATVRADRNARIEARAIDGLGHVQPRREHGAYPGGASGWATVTA